MMRQDQLKKTQNNKVDISKNKKEMSFNTFGANAPKENWWMFQQNMKSFV